MKSYNQFIKESKTDIDSIPKAYGIMNYTINPDGSIDVDGDVGLNNERLTKLPLKFRNVGGDFYCSYNNLPSLEGCPQTVGGDFYCRNNQLTSLEGLPEIIGGDINCIDNYISDFRGVPELFEGCFHCEGNPIEEIYTLFLQENDVDDSKCIQWINEFDVIQGGPSGRFYGKVVLDRLEEVFHQLGMVIPENIKFRSYEII